MSGARQGDAIAQLAAGYLKADCIAKCALKEGGVVREHLLLRVTFQDL